MTSQDESGDAARANAGPPQEPIGTERRGICTVKWWQDAKGYGALSCADTAPWDVWCHFSAIQDEGFRTLAPGESVEVEFYRFDQESFKYLARKVRRLSGSALRTSILCAWMTKPLIGPELKIFDPRDCSTGSGGAEVLDPTVVRRGDRWYMYLAGQAHGFGATEIYSASLPPAAPLSANGWTLTRDSAGEVAPLAAHGASRTWDGSGGRHCPSYVRGWDPHKGTWVERIYYAGAADNLWGPYSIGFLEWDGERWIDQPHPAFVATEDWERGSVYEPNLLYHAGKWRMWYVAGANQDDYLVHGYAESDDGVAGWSEHAIFAPAEMKMFDFCVRPRGDGFDAIFARIWVGGGTPPPGTGLWWCRADTPGGTLSGWSEPVQIMTAADRGWHSGPWKPSLALDERDDERGFVFFDGLYRTDDPGPFPFAFTLGCVAIHLPPQSRHHASAQPADARSILPRARA